MSDMPASWIQSALSHGSSLGDKSKVSFTRKPTALRVTHELDSNISIWKPDGTILVRFMFGGDIHFPYWMPVCTPSGALISICSPHDHIWHRGLWMAWKYVNGINFWEGPFSEEPSYGAQRLQSIERLELRENYLHVLARISWVSADQSIPMAEERTFNFTFPSPDSHYYYIDIESKFSANEKDAVVRSVDIKQFDWGGYGGLGFRASRDLCGFSDRLIVSLNGNISHEVHGARGDWAAYCGLLDGAVERSWAGFALINHRNNPVHPVPFHASAEGICYIGTAPSRYESLTIHRGSPCVLKNRFVCFDGETDQPLIQKLFEEFV